jgi:hypothetical protein
MEPLWSPVVATGGNPSQIESLANGLNQAKLLPSVATSCRWQRMVRRGSTVRVRQRALQKRRNRRFLFGGSCTISSVRCGCGGRADELGWAERRLPTDPRRQASGRNPIRGEERYARYARVQQLRPITCSASPALAERLRRCLAFNLTEWYAFSDHSRIGAPPSRTGAGA